MARRAIEPGRLCLALSGFGMGQAIGAKPNRARRIPRICGAETMAMDWQEACALERSHGDKARAALRRYRQGCFDSEAKARAIYRLKRTRTWAAISAIGAARAITHRGAASGFAMP